MIPLICKYCNKEYKVKPYRQYTSKCCSKKCLWHITKSKREPNRIESISNKKSCNNKRIIINCMNCKKEISISPSREKYTKFCSRKCYAELVKNIYGNNQKYKRISIKGKRIHEHRYIMEIHIGRELNKNEHVHHINHNKNDNRIENLELLNCSDHMKKHKIIPF